MTQTLECLLVISGKSLFVKCMLYIFGHFWKLTTEYSVQMSQQYVTFEHRLYFDLISIL